jgi:hypothetical protein
MVTPPRYRVAAPCLIALLLLIVTASAFVAPQGPLGTAQAATPSFSLPEERVNVTVLQDGSVNIDYIFRFTNVQSLDGVDIGMPNPLYNLSTATARIVVGGTEQVITSIRTSPFIKTGVAVEFDPSTASTIQSAGSFDLYFHINNPHMVYRNDAVPGTAGVKFVPTWFNSQYQVGPTGLLNASIVLPAAMTNLSEALPLTNQPFNGLYFDPSTGRGVATWEGSNVDPNAQASGAFDVGVGFPSQFVAVYFDPSTDPNNQGGNLLGDIGSLFALLFPLLFVAFIVVIIIFSIRSAGRSRSDYFEPKLSVVGAGPRRDLTAVEAAIVLERPLEDVATMMLFGLIRKGKVRVLEESMPMRLQKLAPTGEHAYETAYLNAIRPDGTLDRGGLRSCLIGAIKQTSDKMNGFDLDATKLYYGAIVEKAWKEVTDAKTPEELALTLQERNDWMMMDRDYQGRMARTVFPLPILIPVGRSQVPGFPPSEGGKNLAQDYVDKVRGTSNKLVDDMKGLTRQIAPFTNPAIVAATAAAAGGFRGGGGGHCACACACACAGGGR